MEKIHDADNRSWISKPVCVGQYFQDYSALVQKLKPVRDTSRLSSRWIMKHMGLEDQQVFAQLESVMDVENLSLDDESEPLQVPDPVLDTVQEDSVSRFYRTPISEDARAKMKTLEFQQQWLDILQSDRGSSAKARRKRLSRNDNDHWWLAERPEAGIKNWDLTDRTTVYRVRMYRPTQHFHEDHVGASNLKYSQEVWLLGHHTLTDLRDIFWCNADLNSVGAQQVDTVMKPALKAREVYTSGMIYMDGTFYIDRRNIDNIDYSEVIREWAADPKRELGPFTTETMENVRLDSLALRLGYPYLYTHQGNHEHLFSFIDVRLLGPGDPQSVSEYPLIRSVGYQAGKYCMVCQNTIANWVTMDNQRVTEDPFFWCNNCYAKFNFIDKKRVGNFKAFRYFDPNVL